MMNERVSTIMTKGVVTIGPEDNLDKVLEIVSQNRFHHLPVVDGKKLAGMITTRDLWKSNLKVDEYSKSKVKDFMTSNVVALHENELIGAAAMIFLKHFFHSLPIVDNEENLVGIVTTYDVLRYEFIKAYPNDEFVKETNWLKL